MVKQGQISVEGSPIAIAHEEIGLITRHYRPVHWSPSSRTALAEAELEYNDAHRSTAVFVTFDLDEAALTPKLREMVEAHGRPRLLVWTTTPWTLPSNMVRADLGNSTSR